MQLTGAMPVATWMIFQKKPKIISTAQGDSLVAPKTPAWTRKAGKNPKGGLNAKGRASYKKGTLRPPVKSGDNPRRASFLARMGGMRTGA